MCIIDYEIKPNLEKERIASRSRGKGQCEKRGHISAGSESQQIFPKKTVASTFDTESRSTELIHFFFDLRRTA